MKNRAIFLKITFLLFFIGNSFLINHSLVEAAVNLSVNPVTGGTSLSFGRVDEPLEVNKEVRIRVNSNEGQQYQVFQRLIEPIVNEQGLSLAYDAITSYTLNGSNASGTLYLQSPMNLSQGEELLYTSSPAGDSDGFTVVYSTRAQRLNSSGNFLGKMIYTVRPIGGGSQDTSFLTVTLDSTAEMKLEVAGSVSPNGVRLNYSNGKIDNKEFVRISFNGNRSNPIRIYQEFEVFPQNEQAEELNKDLLKFKVVSNSGPSEFQEETAVERKRVKLYDSNEDTDSIIVHFELDPQETAQQKQGRYHGRVKYIVETASQTKEEVLDLELEVAPIFNVEVKFPPQGVKFGNILPTSPPQISEVEVRVNTNLGKPYMVMQNVVTPLTNPKGNAIDREYFTIKGELKEGDGGRVANNDYVPILPGESPIFFSDSQGSPAAFKIYYRLKAYPDMHPGDYSTSIVYSLGEV